MKTYVRIAALFVFLGGVIFVLSKYQVEACDPIGKTDDGHTVYRLACDQIPTKK